MKKTITILITIAVVAFVGGFLLARSSMADEGRIVTLYKLAWLGGDHIEIIKDEKYNIICYFKKNGYGGGMDCFTEQEIKQSMDK
jgi:hypothetical protein